MSDWPHERSGTLICPDGNERHWRVGNACGEVFAEDVDFDGLTLTIEVASEKDGIALVRLIEAAFK